MPSGFKLTGFIFGVCCCFAHVLPHSKIDAVGRVLLTANLNSRTVNSLNCTTNVMPFGNTVEYLMNNKSIATMRYLPDVNKCILAREPCKKYQCLCQTTWYLYNQTIPVHGKTNNFTCHLRYNNSCESHDIVEKTIIFSGTGIIDIIMLYEIQNTFYCYQVQTIVSNINCNIFIALNLRSKR